MSLDVPTRRPLLLLVALALLGSATTAQIRENDPRYLEDPREISDPREVVDPRDDLTDPRLLPEAVHERFDLHLANESSDRLLSEMSAHPGDVFPWLAGRLDKRHLLASKGDQRTETDLATQARLEQELRETAALADRVLRDTRLGMWVHHELTWTEAALAQRAQTAMLTKRAEAQIGVPGWEDQAFRALGDLRRSMDAARLIGDERELIRVELAMARLYIDEGRPDNARPYLDTAVRRARELFDGQSYDRILGGLYDVAESRNDVGGALAILREQAQLARRMGDPERTWVLEQRRTELGRGSGFPARNRRQGPPTRFR